MSLRRVGISRSGTSPVRLIKGPGFIAEDTFNRENVTGAVGVGNGWTPEMGVISIASNCLVWGTGGSGGYMRLYTTFPSNPPISGDIAVEIDMPAATVRPYTGLLMRYNPSDHTGVRVFIEGSIHSLTVGDPGDFAFNNVILSLSSFPAGWGSDALNTLRAELVGDVITVIAKTTTVPNGQTIGVGTIANNSSIADGAVGFCGESSGKAFDAIRVYNL